MKIPFDIKYRDKIESGEYKVETRDGRPVRIVCYDRKYGYPIMALATEADGHEIYVNCNFDGRESRIYEWPADLFIVTPEPEQSEDERIRKEIVGFIDNVLKDKNVLLLVADRIGDNIPSMIPDWIAYLERQKPAKWSAEDEKIRKRIINILGNNTDAHEEGWAVYADEIAWLKNQKEQNTLSTKETELNSIAFLEQLGYTCVPPGAEQKPKLEIYTRTKSKSFMESYMKGWNDAMEAIKKEQKSAESDEIKGGDFISDGKRVFLVLSNVKERNLGETSSTFCEGRILGVDGVVYCNGDDFKNFKRATSDERAKFIHDLKVGVELKEQPAEWSDKDESYLQTVINEMEANKKEAREYEHKKYDTIILWLKSLRPQPHWKPSEEQISALEYFIRSWGESGTMSPQNPTLCAAKSLHSNLKNL